MCLCIHVKEIIPEKIKMNNKCVSSTQYYRIIHVPFATYTGNVARIYVLISMFVIQDRKYILESFGQYIYI